MMTPNKIWVAHRRYDSVGAPPAESSVIGGPWEH